YELDKEKWIEIEGENDENEIEEVNDEGDEDEIDNE
ncbi:hypothetical protein VAMP_211n93, partial [Candidatus Vampirococcus lugosii]|nr:hypothetical protein [Candidatus Vampirococcus lugosii]